MTGRHVDFQAIPVAEVGALAELFDRADAAVRAIQAVEDLHVAVPLPRDWRAFLAVATCLECTQRWPCRTKVALDVAYGRTT